MSTGFLTLNEQKVPAEISDKNVINITINQESSLSYLFKSVGQCWARQQEPTQKTQQSPASAPTTARHFSLHCNGEQKVLGGAQILLGIVVISLGLVNDYGHLFYIRSGAPYWMGGLVMLSGALSIMGERRAGFWVHVATIFHLASVVAGIVALTKGIAWIPNLDQTFSWRKGVCQTRWGPSPILPSPGYDWRQRDCERILWDLMGVAFAVKVLLLIFSVAALAIALFCLAYSLRILCCARKASSADSGAVGDLDVAPLDQDEAIIENIA
ncbi:transmembrane protein 176B-like [Podarcis raffonei]|uniref:transmembrane protein 176B-like n=1 Tax=Podarcis raffonei TaxID=65483 RepID=UPI0023299DB7|nr:transmembrane protein 176B-like [Podarcis raffonei]